MYVETDTRMKKIMVRYFVEKAMEERRDGVCYQKEAIALDTPFTSVPECCRLKRARRSKSRQRCTNPRPCSTLQQKSDHKTKPYC
jgi:hypothetical protein